MRYGVYDVETRSVLDLRQFGAHNYARDPSTDLWFVSFCILTNGIPGPILTWQRGEPPPAEVIDLHADPEGLIAAFPDAFERQIEQNILGPRYSWPIFPIERRRCLQAFVVATSPSAATFILRQRPQPGGVWLPPLLERLHPECIGEEVAASRQRATQRPTRSFSNCSTACAPKIGT